MRTIELQCLIKERQLGNNYTEIHNAAHVTINGCQSAQLMPTDGVERQLGGGWEGLFWTIKSKQNRTGLQLYYLEL